MAFDTRTPRLYLASRSPRRRELLTQIGVQFDTLFYRENARQSGDDDVDEAALGGEDPASYVRRVALAKARYGWNVVDFRRLLSQPVLAADTTLEFDGEIIGKPSDTADACAILRRLSGQTHRVLTAVAIIFERQMETALSISEVRFCRLDEGDIRRYVASGEPMDKAGAYGIQGRAGMFVEHLSGSYSGVMGLPLHETARLLKRLDFPL